MIETTWPPLGVAMKVVDTRGTDWPAPLDQLVQTVFEGWVGETIAVRTTDRSCLVDVAQWVSNAGHGLIGIYERHGYDEVIVEIRH